LPFSESKPQLITIDVNDQQRSQPIDSFGVALTGGSAELLMRMASDRRTALLRELFATKDNDIGISFANPGVGQLRRSPTTVEPCSPTGDSLSKRSMGRQFSANQKDGGHRRPSGL
jgi:O-glycosyl hydrolase